MSTFGSRRDLYNRLSRDTSRPSFLNLILKYAFYLSGLALIIFIFLIVLHFFGIRIFKFGADGGGIIPIPAPTNRQIMFNKQIMAVSDAGKFNNLVGMKYTVSIDVYVESDFVSQSVPRVFLYRSGSPITLNSRQFNIDQVSAQMMSSNFIMYLDSDKNDLNVRIFTVGVGSDTVLSSGPVAETVASAAPDPAALAAALAEADTTAEATCSAATATAEAQKAALIEGKQPPTPSQPSQTPQAPITRDTYVPPPRAYIDMPPIENIPLRTGFKITMMLSDVLLELYINGELQRSVPLPNPPADLESTSYFYGPPVISRRSIFTSNLSYWNTMLSASSIRVYGKEPVDNTLWLMN